MSAYLALAAISVLAGFGLLTRLRLPVSPLHRWYLAPGATMLVWAIALGVGVSLGLTLRNLSGPLLALTMVVAILGALDARRAWAVAKPTGLLILAAVPLAVMAMDVAAGLSQYIGGPAQDGWSYVAYGQYLWEWPKGTEGGLAPLYQYAAHLSRARFISSAMLAFFSPMTGAGGDTQAAAGAFVAWTLFVFGASCAASAVALGIRRGWLVLFTAIAVMSPWVYAAVQIHNYDNLMALSFLPVAMSVLAAAERPGTSVAVLLGAVLAATLYTYPEMSVFVGFGLALAVACRATQDRLWMAWGKTCLLAGALAALLLIPGRADLAWFISSQLQLGDRRRGHPRRRGHFSVSARLREVADRLLGLSDRTEHARSRSPPAISSPVRSGSSPSWASWACCAGAGGTSSCSAWVSRPAPCCWSRGSTTTTGPTSSCSSGTGRWPPP